MRRQISLTAIAVAMITLLAIMVPVSAQTTVIEGMYRYRVTLEPLNVSLPPVIRVYLYDNSVVVVAHDLGWAVTGVAVYGFGSYVYLADAYLASTWQSIPVAVNGSGIYFYALFGYDSTINRFTSMKLVRVYNGTYDLIDVNINAEEVGAVLGTVYVDGRLIGFYTNATDIKLYAMYENGTAVRLDSIDIGDAFYPYSIIGYNSTHIFIADTSNNDICIFDSDLNPIACTDVAGSYGFVWDMAVYDDQIYVLASDFRFGFHALILDRNLRLIGDYAYPTVCGRIVNNTFVSSVYLYDYGLWIVLANETGVLLKDLYILACSVDRSGTIYEIAEYGGRYYVVVVKLGPVEPEIVTTTVTTTVTVPGGGYDIVGSVLESVGGAIAVITVFVAMFIALVVVEKMRGSVERTLY